FPTKRSIEPETFRIIVVSIASRALSAVTSKPNRSNAWIKPIAPRRRCSTYSGERSVSTSFQWIDMKVTAVTRPPATNTTMPRASAVRTPRLRSHRSGARMRPEKNRETNSGASTSEAARKLATTMHSAAKKTKPRWSRENESESVVPDMPGVFAAAARVQARSLGSPQPRSLRDVHAPWRGRGSVARRGAGRACADARRTGGARRPAPPIAEVRRTWFRAWMERGAGAVLCSPDGASLEPRSRRDVSLRATAPSQRDEAEEAQRRGEAR